LVKHTRWGVRIYHAVLYRPRSPTRRVVAIPKWQGGIQTAQGDKESGSLGRHEHHCTVCNPCQTRRNRPCIRKLD